ncbi:fluoride efflux transporter FluC [Microbacterium sp. NPDC056234]|uniref:fluoride efflux transporter FluC n=1 Tax=Microbacterium sp. NPDC056234 TaxID=3345757 RepID=UPI0035D9ABD3
MTFRRLLLVVLGGTLGTAGRLLLGLWMPQPEGVPLATIVVNVLGALLIGVLAARLPAASDLRVFLATGVLGGFTTYSAFAVSSIELWQGSPWLALAVVVASLGLGVLAAAAGMRLATTRRRSGER